MPRWAGLWQVAFRAVLSRVMFAIGRFLCRVGSCRVVYSGRVGPCRVTRWGFSCAALGWVGQVAFRAVLVVSCRVVSVSCAVLVVSCLTGLGLPSVPFLLHPSMGAV